MPALVPTAHAGIITWLGHMPRPVRPDLIIETEALDEMALGWGGFARESHSGLTRASCSRVTRQHPKGTTIGNTRQVSLVGAEEMALVAAELGLAAMDYAWLGASVVIEGIADFTHLPPSSRLQADDGCTLVVDMMNLPCTQVSKTIETAQPGHGRAFKVAAKGRRGVTAWVERPGVLRLGGIMRLHVPAQRVWAPVAGWAPGDGQATGPIADLTRGMSQSPFTVQPVSARTDSRPQGTGHEPQDRHRDRARGQQEADPGDRGQARDRCAEPSALRT